MLTAVFENGQGMVDHGLGGMTSSGPGLSTGALAASTTFTLVVTNVIGDSVSATATVTVGTVGAFAATGSMGTGRHGHTATRLKDGRVLIAGGILEGGAPGWATGLASAEIYDPDSGTFAATGSMGTARSNHTATLLQDGTVLVAGGYGADASTSAEIYDPGSGTFTATGAMATARAWHAATLLPNGQALLAGGEYLPVRSSASAELYDPHTGLFSAAGSMAEARSRHMATLLPNGTVLVAGGYNGVSYLVSAEVFTPGTGTFTATGGLGAGTSGRQAPLLGNGQVLVTGSGWAEVYDPGAGAFSYTGPPLSASSKWSAPLQDGKALVVDDVGGYDTATAEVYDPGTGTFIHTGSPGLGRPGCAATLLQNGKVLVTGGYYGVMIAVSNNSAMLFDPSTLQ
jgi:hypothetical protein